jgi:hypothetical protein
VQIVKVKRTSGHKTIFIYQCTLSAYNGFGPVIKAKRHFQLYRDGGDSHSQFYHIKLLRVHICMNKNRNHNFSIDMH